jgi:lipid-binding SYLF domain-containing protein
MRQSSREILRRASAVLEQLTTNTSEPLPDAVLSRAQCLVLLPDAGMRQSEIATVTCRTGNNWSAPTFARVRAILTAPPRSSLMVNTGRRQESPGDLLIFIMSDRALQALLSGSVKIGSEMLVDAGPLISQAPIVTDVELKASDGLAYVRRGGALRGLPITSGTLELDPEMSRQLYGAASTPSALLKGANTRSAANSSFNSMVNSFFYLIKPTGIIIHHSVLLPEPEAAAQVLDDFHSQRGFSVYCFGRVYHVAYHYLILPDGTIKAGRPERCRGAHTRGYNSYLGIALVGDFSSVDNPNGKKGHVVPTAAQMNSLLQLCRELRERYRIPLHRIVRHSDISNTYCPGDRFLFKEFLAALDQPHQRGS